MFDGLYSIFSALLNSKNSQELEQGAQALAQHADPSLIDPILKQSPVAPFMESGIVQKPPMAQPQPYNLDQSVVSPQAETSQSATPKKQVELTQEEWQKLLSMGPQYDPSQYKMAPAAFPGKSASAIPAPQPIPMPQTPVVNPQQRLTLSQILGGR
jgi:hypothetical protein